MTGILLTGGRIRIRSYQASDLDFVTGMWQDEENGRYLSDPTHGYVDAAYQKALDGMQDDPSGYYLIVERLDSGERIGSACAFPDAAAKIYDIGYCLHASHWKKGYGTELVTLLLGWLKELGAAAVTAEVAEENVASRALLSKLGFGIVREAEFKKYHMDVRFKSHIYRKEL